MSVYRTIGPLVLISAEFGTIKERFRHFAELIQILEPSLNISEILI